MTRLVGANKTAWSLFAITTVLLTVSPFLQSGGNLRGTLAYLTQFGLVFGIFAIICVGLNVQLGYAGISNFGIAGFFLLGSYVAAVFVLPPASSEFVTYIGGLGLLLDPMPALGTTHWVPFAVAMVAAGLACGILAAFLAVVTPRLRLDYLAIATIGVAELLRSVTTVEVGLVNGDRGLIGIPGPFQGLVAGPDYQFLLLGIVLGIVAIVFWGSERAVRSPWGRVLRALREDETATAASGKNVFAFKLQAFVFGGVVIGIGAALFSFYRHSLSPSDFTPLQGTFLFWVMLIVGGTGSNRGALLGTFVVWGLWTASLQLSALPLPAELSSRLPFVRYVLLGVFFIAALYLRPQGLIQEERRVSVWVNRLPRGMSAASRGQDPSPEVAPSETDSQSRPSK